ncbi:MAG: hypothetical protein B6I20_00325 [Bacteroidetes bacterium 4572_117]|nr:MAG: hypothetical protein B6I20_00325 [Bacteroidetes bacterium 4572_117]
MVLYKKALKSYINNFGEKHPYTADMYETFGDYYLGQKKNEEALKYYQKSLISNSGDFNSSNIYKNPGLEHILSELNLLRSLKKKSETLLVMSTAKTKDKEKNLKLSIESLELALELINNVRQGYVSLESKLYITENEKEFYISAIENALQLFELTADKTYVEKAYKFAQRCKAAVLLSEIKQNEAFVNVISDSLKEHKTTLLQNIAAFKKLIFDENKKRGANQEKISHWQSELFKMNKKHEILLENIKENYPAYSKLLAKTKLIDLAKIKEELSVDETLIEYSYLTNKQSGQLYAFVINKNGLRYKRIKIDSTFERNIELFRKKINQVEETNYTLQEYNNYNQTLYSLYNVLLKPLKLENKKIVVVPDEKIAYLSFDALISEYKQEAFINYAGLPYLIFDYRFSYAYSSSLLFSYQKENRYMNYVYAFAPNYRTKNQVESPYLFSELKRAKEEIKSIIEYFNGTTYIGDSATKSKFKSIISKKGIFHLALHANSEKDNPDYSFLAFSPNINSNESNLMYNYEIHRAQINASMVVLSACNTGDGRVYSGEGVMSLSRGFTLAGALSVVHTLWRISDESSAVIMHDFYKYLSAGKSKSEALQLAKINYIENSSPELVNPKYWSGFVLLGDYSPLHRSHNQLSYLLIGLLLIVAIFFLFFVKRNKQKVK